MSQIRITCPHCGERFEIPFDDEQAVGLVFLRCFKCGTPLVHALRSDRTVEASGEANATVEMDDAIFRELCAKRLRRTSVPFRPVRERANSGSGDKPPISTDDVIEIHTMLAESKDFDDFLAKL